MFIDTQQTHGRPADIIPAYQLPSSFHDFIEAGKNIRFFQWGHAHAVDAGDVFHMSLITTTKDENGLIDSASFTITNEDTGESEDVILRRSGKSMTANAGNREIVIYSLPHFFDRDLDLPRAKSSASARGMITYEEKVVSALLSLGKCEDAVECEPSAAYRIF